MSGITIGLRVPARGKIGQESLNTMLKAMTAMNYRYLLRHPNTPLLAKSGIRYRREPRGRENWQLIPDLLESGFGDCEDLGTYRAAELWFHGVKALPIAIGKNGKWHVKVVALINGRRVMQDPSRELGMNKKSSS